MANNINHIILEGTLISDVDVRTMQAKNPNERARCVVKGRLASDYDTKRLQDGSYTHSTVYIDFDYWMPAESSLAIASAKKGDTFLITGMLVDMSYTNKEGQKIFRIGIRAEESIVSEGSFVKKDNAAAYTAQPVAPAQNAQPAYAPQAPQQNYAPQQPYAPQQAYAPQQPYAPNPNYAAPAPNGVPADGNIPF